MTTRPLFPVLLALVATGMPRDDAYRIVQSNAMLEWETRTNFRTLVEADAHLERAGIGKEVLDSAFDLKRSLTNIDRTFQALEAIK